MSSLALLKDMLNPRVIVNGNTTDPEETVVVLEEKKEGSMTGKISLHVPSGSVVFRLDSPGEKSVREFSIKSPFLNPGKTKLNLHKGCDYVVLCKHRGKYWFVLIEMKSENPSGALEQLCCSSVFVRYLRELIFLHNGDVDRYEILYVVFTTSPRFKEQTRAGKAQYTQYRVDSEKNNFHYYKMPPPSKLTLTQLLDCEPQTESARCDLFNRSRCWHAPAKTPSTPQPAGDG
ncbi:MAG: hypothetical protein H7836_07810 [Magnetococcus sp. YQC-3]